VEKNASSSRNLLILSVTINILFASIASFSVWQRDDLSSRVSELSESYRNLEQQLNLTSTQLNYYKEQAEYYSSLIASGNATIGIIGHTTVPIVAVLAIRRAFRVEYEGVVMTADVELREGSGRILVDTMPKIGIDIQTSVTTAVLVAEDITGVSLGKTDLILTIKASEDVEVVDGASAGAAVTVALIATMKGQDLNRTVYMTGTINSDNTIGPIGGIAQKGTAAAENGSRCFLVPKRQSTIVVYVPKETHPFPGWTVITYEQKIVKLQDYLEEQGYSTIVLEVETIEEAYAEFSV